MIFSSITFLYVFLPLCLLTYYVSWAKAKNVILLIFSLLFYSFGEPRLLYVIVGCIIFVYCGALLLEKFNSTLLYAILIILSISPLIYFKYTNFFISNINNLFNLNINLFKITLPLGISFYTFQMISYLIDVKRKYIPAEKNLIKLALYVCFFPQLIAGPIVTYKCIKDHINQRELTVDKINSGILLFIIGLGKKVLIANQLGELCSLYTHKNATICFTWIWAIAFTLQIYFDFSGYSTMAIGLGKLFGFELPINFNYPFISKSIKEFWTRWHITLSKFFKNYVYIPLGGSRCSKARNIFNLFIVWFLTGFWHGANWQFILWGLLFFICLCIEKYILKFTINSFVAHIGTLFIIIISFLIFGSDNLSDMIFKLKHLVTGKFIDTNTIFIIRNYCIIIVFAIIGSTPLLKHLYNKVLKDHKWTFILETIFIAGVLILSTAYLIDGSFNPFLYFRF